MSIINLFKYSEDNERNNNTEKLLLKNINLYAPHLWAKTKKNEILSSYFNPEVLERIQNGDTEGLISNNPWVVLLIGFLIILEKILQKSEFMEGESAEEDKEQELSTEMMDIYKYWDFNYSHKNTSVIGTTKEEKYEVKRRLGTFDTILEERKINITRVQNSFMTLLF